MTPSLAVEGHIEIRLSVRERIISRVDITNRRLLTAPRVLIGQPAAEAPRLLGRLFSVCRTAQSLAAARAMEEAAGLPAAPAQQAARRLLLFGETLSEHAGRAAMDWPMLAGEAPALPALKRLRQMLDDLPRLLYPGGDWASPGGGRLQPDRPMLRQYLDDIAQILDSHDFLPPMDPDAWDGWLAAGQGLPARFLALLSRRGLADWGACPVAPLPDLDAGMLAQRLAKDVEGHYIRQPDWRGRVHETGPLARAGEHPLLAELIARHGRGLLARLAARLLEMGIALRDMRELADALCDDAGGAADFAGGAAKLSGQGLGMVEAVRGRLAHRVIVDGGKVADYQTLAPTEWNFHPAGVLAQGLEGRPAGGDAAALARLAVTALDPCVAYRVEVA